MTKILGYYGTRTGEPYCLKCAGLAHEGEPIEKCDLATFCFICGEPIDVWGYLEQFKPGLCAIQYE